MPEDFKDRVLPIGGMSVRCHLHGPHIFCVGENEVARFIKQALIFMAFGAGFGFFWGVGTLK